MTPAVRLCLFAYIFSIATFAHADPQAGLPLTPVFFNTPGQSGPVFAYAFTNDTGKNINLLRDCSNSSIVLDGKEHGRWITVWAGYDTLRPGNTFTDYLNINYYLAEYAKAGNKWTPAVLSEGIHTLTFSIGGKIYGPVQFIWHSQAPR